MEHLAHRLLGERDPEWLAAHVPCASSASWECSSLWEVAEKLTFWWHVYICQHFSITPKRLLINEQQISRNHLANHKIIFLLNNICMSLHWGLSVLITLPYQKIWWCPFFETGLKFSCNFLKGLVKNILQFGAQFTKKNVCKDSNFILFCFSLTLLPRHSSALFLTLDHNSFTWLRSPSHLSSHLVLMPMHVCLFVLQSKFHKFLDLGIDRI